jgi:hypothetical protein
MRNRPLRERDSNVWLNLATRARSQIAHLHHQARALHRIELKDKRSNLSHEWIGRKRCDFILARTSISAQQVRDRDLKCGGQACERRQRRRCLLILDFRYVCAWHLHASGELSLTEPGAAAE